MREVSVTAFRGRIAEFIAAAGAGDEIVITRRGKAAAGLIAVEDENRSENERGMRQSGFVSIGIGCARRVARPRWRRLSPGRTKGGGEPDYSRHSALGPARSVWAGALVSPLLL